MKIRNIFLPLLIFTLSLVNTQAKESDAPGPLVGSSAPHWSLKTSKGKFEHLGKYSASENDQKWKESNDRKVIVLSFFASWCQPCIKEIGELHKLKENYAGDQIEFFLVNLTDFFRHREKDTKKYFEAPSAMEFLQEKGLTDITVLEDPTGRTARAYGVSDVLPRLFIIDKYRTIKMDETGLCSSCLVDVAIPLIDGLLAE